MVYAASILNAIKELTMALDFQRRHCQAEVMLMLVRWYVAYALSYRDVHELAAERGLSVDHSTVHRWVVTDAPRLEPEFRRRSKRAVGRRWRMDETYIKVKGRWCYCYRAVDSDGQTVDFLLSETRDESAARALFSRAMAHQSWPEIVTLDGSRANQAALNTLNLWLELIWLHLGGWRWPKGVWIEQRTSRYLHNRIEQDHRGIKRLVKPMMGFQTLATAQATLAGIELHRMLKKNQHSQAGNQTIFKQFQGLAS
jgi:putative transposase